MGSESTSFAPIHVHVHGGSWTLFSKDEESFIAPVFVEAGAICIVIGFSNIPKVRIPEMVEQVKRALLTNWQKEFGLPANVVKSALLISGTLVYGEKETPEFKRQPRAFAVALAAAGKPVRLVEIAGVNHFEGLQQFGDAKSELARLALGLMALA